MDNEFGMMLAVMFITAYYFIVIFLAWGLLLANTNPSTVCFDCAVVLLVSLEVIALRFRLNIHISSCLQNQKEIS